MTAESIRCIHDLQLYDALIAEQEVVRVNRAIEMQEQQSRNSSIRRQLLATSVRLSPTISKPLHRIANRCIERLGIDEKLELYAYPSPQFNAACFKPEDGRVFVMFSSSLLEAFSEKELLFVMGHELGHHLYRHHDIPIGYILRGDTPPPTQLALRLFAWSRYAEVSADRAGAYCAQDLQSVARALFKLASGITHEGIISFDLEAFLSQVDDMLAFDNDPGKGAPTQDWFSTHPFSPMRVKALKQFHSSVMMNDAGMSREQLELAVQDVMSLMEPSYIEGKSDTAKSMRRLFIAGAMVLVHTHGGLKPEERQALKSFFGDDLDLDRLDADRLRDILPQRIKDAKAHTSVPQRMQVIRDLCIIVRADGESAREELAILHQITDGLEVPRAYAAQHATCQFELD